MKDCIPREGAHTGAGEEHEEEMAAETKCSELITMPLPHLPAPLEGKENVQDLAMKE